MQKTLRPVGFWYSKEEPNYPKPVANTDKLTKRQRRKLVRYLTGHTTYSHYKGSSMCRLCHCTNGSSDKSDGVWLWPSGLAHYVEDHHVKLPKAFMDDVLGVGWDEPDDRVTTKQDRKDATIIGVLQAYESYKEQMMNLPHGEGVYIGFGTEARASKRVEELLDAVIDRRVKAILKRQRER